MKNLLGENTIYKVAAVFLALVLWYNATDQQNPNIEEVFNVPLEVRELAPSLALADIPGSVQVRVEGRNTVIDRISSKDFHAFIKLEEAGAGQNSADVEVTVPTGVRLVSVSPSKVQVRVAEKTKVQVPITVELSGEPAPGHKILTPVVEPAEAVITGPQSVVAQVKSVMVQVSLNNNQREDFVRVLPIIIESQDWVNYSIAITPTSARVFIPIVPESGSKTVPVQAVLMGQPANGFEITRVEVSPDSMEIFGLEQDLDAVEYLRTFSVDVSGRDESFTRNVGVNVPQNVEPAMQASVNVFVEIVSK